MRPSRTLASRRRDKCASQVLSKSRGWGGPVGSPLPVPKRSSFLSLVAGTRGIYGLKGQGSQSHRSLTSTYVAVQAGRSLSDVFVYSFFRLVGPRPLPDATPKEAQLTRLGELGIELLPHNHRLKAGRPRTKAGFAAPSSRDLDAHWRAAIRDSSVEKDANHLVLVAIQ